MVDGLNGFLSLTANIFVYEMRVFWCFHVLRSKEIATSADSK